MTKCFICGNAIASGSRKHWIYCAQCDQKISAEDQLKIHKLRIFCVLVIPYLQTLFYYGNKYHTLQPHENSAGEQEQDRTSHLFNLIEGLGIYAIIQFAMWFLIGYLDMQKGWAVAGYFGYGLFGIFGLWAIFLSPYFHGDKWHGLGFSIPLEIFPFSKELLPEHKVRHWVTFVLVACLTMILVLPNWEYTLIRWGLRGQNHALFLELTTELWGKIVALAFGLLLFILLALFLIRWDNFHSVLKQMIWLCLIFWGAIVIVGMIYAIVLGDWKQFHEFKLWSNDTNSLITHSAFYTIWGLLQQWLFLGYFNTRIRKGIPNRKFGSISSRIITSLLTGVCFACIHIPAMPLMTLTFIGGSLFGWFFQKDEYRNLFIMGIAHGVGGTLVGMLTPMVMNVGPWAL